MRVITKKDLSPEFIELLEVANKLPMPKLEAYATMIDEFINSYINSSNVKIANEMQTNILYLMEELRMDCMKQVEPQGEC